MPAIDHSDEVRRLIIATLKANASVSALAGDRVYDEPPHDPTWPFIRYGSPVAGGFEAACWDGSTHQATIHAFAKGPGSGACARLAKAIVSALEPMVATAGVSIVEMQWVSTQILPDPDEKAAYHAVIQYDLITVEPSQLA